MERLFENLGSWTPSCKGQHADAHWVWGTAIKLNPLWKAEVSKSAWIKPWWGKNAKMTQNDKKLYQSCLISQEPYIIWYSFKVHMCKRIISPHFFFHFLQVLIFWVANKGYSHFNGQHCVTKVLQSSTDSTHSDERACKEVMCTKVHARKSIKTPSGSTLMLFKIVSYFCVWKQLIFGIIRSDIHNLVHLRSCC